jgi:impB/mucB/samB family protein
VTLKVKFADFELISRSRSVVGAVGSRGELELATSDLLKTIFPTKKAVRLLGVSPDSSMYKEALRFRFLCFSGDGERQILRLHRFSLSRPSTRIPEWHAYS